VNTPIRVPDLLIHHSEFMGQGLPELQSAPLKGRYLSLTPERYRMVHIVYSCSSRRSPRRPRVRKKQSPYGAKTPRFQQGNGQAIAHYQCGVVLGGCQLTGEFLVPNVQRAKWLQCRIDCGSPVM